MRLFSDALYKATSGSSSVSTIFPVVFDQSGKGITKEPQLFHQVSKALQPVYVPEWNKAAPYGDLPVTVSIG